MTTSHINRIFDQLSKPMKFYSLLIIFFCAQYVLFSQNSSNEQNLFSAQLEFASNPSQIYEQNGIRIIAKLEKCNDPAIGMEKDYIFFSFENTNSYNVDIKLDQHLYYENICRTCENDEYHKTFVLKSGEKKTSNCNTSSSKSFKVFYSSPWISEKLSKFELVNIKIEKQ